MRQGVEGGQLKVLSKDNVLELYLSILRLLKEHGVHIMHQGALKLLTENGVEVDFKKSVAYFPEYIVEETLRKAPKSIRLCGRNSKEDFVVEGKRVFFGTLGGMTQIYDIHTQDRRQCVTADISDAARIMDSLPNIDFVMGMGTPDVPRHLIGLYEEKAILSNTTKHAVLQTFHGGDMTRSQIEMAELVAGGQEELKKRPIVSLYNEPLSPMMFGQDYVESLIVWTQAGLPIVWAGMPISGATSPITQAGQIVQGMAESLAGNVIAQTVNPGTPFIIGFVPVTMEMREGLAIYSDPKSLSAGIAQAQIAHFLGLPMWGTGGCSNSKTLDSQAILESSLSLAFAALSGQNLIHDIGLIESAIAWGHESLVIYDDLIRMLKVVMKPMRIDYETMAVEAIVEAGHDGSGFLGLPHTLRHFDEEYFPSGLMDYGNRKIWEDEGSKDLWRRARDKARVILRDHKPEPLPSQILNQLDAMVHNYSERR